MTIPFFSYEVREMTNQIFVVGGRRNDQPILFVVGRRNEYTFFSLVVGGMTINYDQSFFVGGRRNDHQILCGSRS